MGVCMAEGHGVVEGIDPNGSVAQWNSAGPPETQVSLGDRIDGFKVKGRSLQKLINGDELSKVKSRAVVLQLVKPSIYTVKGKAPYGLATRRKRNTDKTFYVVSNVYPAGSIEKWNNENPDMCVSVGDIVREVNGVKGSGRGARYVVNRPRRRERACDFSLPSQGVKLGFAYVSQISDHQLRHRNNEQSASRFFWWCTWD